jgi:hypothetical protein
VSLRDVFFKVLKAKKALMPRSESRRMLEASLQAASDKGRSAFLAFPSGRPLFCPGFVAPSSRNSLHYASSVAPRQCKKRGSAKHEKNIPEAQ